MSLFSGSRSCGLSFLMLRRDDLYSSVPIGTISVFSVLNLAPETWHQRSRISRILSRLSCSLRKSMVSSANSLILGLCGAFGMSILIISRSDLMLQASGSIARLKRGHDSGSPCWTPRWTLKGRLSTPLIATVVVAC